MPIDRFLLVRKKPIAGRFSALLLVLVSIVPAASGEALTIADVTRLALADPDRLATFAETTFWYVLPSMPMFLLIGAMLRHGVSFWMTLGVGALVTLALYAVTTLLLGVFHPGNDGHPVPAFLS